MDVETLVEQALDEAVPAGEWESLPEAQAAELVARLKQEADRHWGIDPHRSLELAELIVAVGRARQDFRHIALGWMARGDALWRIGRTTEAWQALEAAGEMFREAGDESGWARTRIGRLALATMLNRVPQALEEAEQARAILLRHDDQDKLLRLDFQTAYVYNYLGEPQQALEWFRSALAIAEGLGEAGQAYFGPLYLNMGGAYQVLGDLRQALHYYEMARARFTERHETLNQVTSEINIAYIAQVQGQYRRALHLLHGVLEQVGERFPAEAAYAKRDMVACYLHLNRYQEARQMARQVSSDYRQLEDTFELARALLQLATAEARLENFAAAQAALDEAEAIFSSLGATTWAASASLRRGQVFLRSGAVEQALQTAASAAALFASAGQRVNQARATLLHGQACSALGKLHEAAEAGTAALKFAQHDNLAALRTSAHLLLGQLAEKEGRLPRAIRHYQAAGATIERVQRGLTITLQPGFLEDKDEVWRALIGLHLGAGQVQRAFESLERAKSQVLLGYLANRERLRWAREDQTSRALIAELDRLRAEHQWYYQLAHESQPDPQGQVYMDPNQALEEVRARERRMLAITERLYLNSAEAQASNPTVPPCLPDVQRKLDENTQLIEYYVDGEKLWAFTLDGNSIAVHPLPVSREELSRMLAQLQANLAAGLKVGPRSAAGKNLTRLAERILQRLHAGLFEPLGITPDRTSRLLVVPFGALHYLPFHLLHDGARYLIEEYEVVALPAAGLALQSGPKRRPGALVLAHDWEGRLPYTGEEAQRVQALFGGQVYAGEIANRSAFEAQPAQVLHIAAHGQFRLDQPDLSFIQLADGQLYADDLLQQDVSYELVTLSACETGRAQIAGGDEPIGLGRGFLYAGAGALVLSLWQVPDDTTLRLMEKMYQALRGGASKAAALRAAQRSVLGETGELHPAYWGAFQLVGDPSPLSRQIAENEQIGANP